MAKRDWDGRSRARAERPHLGRKSSESALDGLGRPQSASSGDVRPSDKPRHMETFNMK